MFKVNLTDAKTHLSRYLNSVGKGETIVICRGNVPIAEIRPIPKPPMKMRLVGIDSGMTIPPGFLDALPNDLLNAFEGSNG